MGEFRAPTEMNLEVPKPGFSCPLPSAHTQSQKNRSSSGGFGLWEEKKKTLAKLICRFADDAALLTHIGVMIQRLR